MAPSSKGGGRLSPIPRAPSPGNPGDAPRPSISSGRSMKRSQADFEAALLDPSSTIFLRASPTFEATESMPQQRTTTAMNGDDVNAPIPVEKRSYEDDLRDFGKDGIRSTSTYTEENDKFGVIPPTPSPRKVLNKPVNRRISHATMESQDGGKSTTSPGRMSISAVSTSSSKKGVSLGIDAELNESQKMTEGSGKDKKRRSMFKSPKTASSSDLATIARKNQDLKGHTLPAFPPTQHRQATESPTPSGPSQNKLQKPVCPTRQAPQPPLPAPQPPGSVKSPNGSRTISRGTIGSVNGGEEGPDRFSDLRSLGSGSSDKMATISERASTPSRNSSQEPKSLRNKAKGMFGRMFGNSSSPSNNTTKLGSSDRSQPPVPPLPSSYHRESTVRNRTVSSPNEPGPSSPKPFPAPKSNDAPTLPPQEQSETAQEGRQSITPTGRRPSEGGYPQTDKPLPPLAISDHNSNSPNRSRTSSMHGTMHRRQPAENNANDEIPDYLHRPSPRRPATMSFSDDVAGIFDSIGQTEPAKELGLPPESIRIRRGSAGGPTSNHQRFPADLGRSMSVDAAAGMDHSHLGIPMPISQRTSSLPANGSPRPDDIASTFPRATSSPSPQFDVLETSPLVAPALSRACSKRSVEDTKGETSSHGASGKPVLGPPVIASISDFGPELHNGDSTITRRGSDLPPLLAASVRLVTTPRSGHSNGLFAKDGPWGRQSPSPRPVTPVNRDLSGTPDTQRTPGRGEDTDEERGRRLACEVLDDDFSSISRDKVAEFLGGPRRVNAIALRYYMSYFDMKGQTLVESFRDLCAKLHLRAESQEIDRIIEGFSARYYDCNPTTVFGSPGVVHTVTGAMLMLNTDLHIADLSKHMTRPDFVRNAMRAIQESMPADGAVTANSVRDDSGTVKLGSNSSLSTVARSRPTTANSVTARSASAPVAAQPQIRQDNERSVSAAVNPMGQSRSTSTSSFNYSKQWETEAENALKDIFNQVKSDKILLPIGNNAPDSNRQSMISLSSDNKGSTLRSPSGKSNDRVNALKRGSIRGMQGLIGSSPYATSDGRSSPTGSYATSMGDNANFAATIGFASNLSHTVIREHDDEKDSGDSVVSTDTMDEDLNDDELALLGAPWAKEGILWRRTGTDATLRKTSKKDWKQFFAVVQGGEMLLFTFGEGSGSGSFGAVGGGNWLNNANAAGRYSLMHTSSVPLKGGYARDRPYVFAVNLPNKDALYLQAGTDDLVTEWVQTCNYWSARRTRQPLQGGVSNVEYGWNRVLDQSYSSKEDNAEDDRASVMSGRSNMSRLNASTYGRRSHSMTPADRLHIVDWKPPQPSLMPSPLDEENQLEALLGYVKSLSEELDQHQRIREQMITLYTPHSKNAMKAMSNWTIRYKYLVAELARYEGYVDTLREAIGLRIKKQGEKRLEKSLARSMTSFQRRESADSRLASSVGTTASKGFRERRAMSFGLNDGSEDKNGDIKEELATTPIQERSRIEV